MTHCCIQLPKEIEYDDILLTNNNYRIDDALLNTATKETELKKWCAMEYNCREKPREQCNENNYVESDVIDGSLQEVMGTIENDMLLKSNHQETTYWNVQQPRKQCN